MRIVLPETGPAELEQFAAPTRLNDSALTYFFLLKLGEIWPHTHTSGRCANISKMAQEG